MPSSSHQRSSTILMASRKKMRLKRRNALFNTRSLWSLRWLMSSAAKSFGQRLRHPTTPSICASVSMPSGGCIHLIVIHAGFSCSCFPIYSCELLLAWSNKRCLHLFLYNAGVQNRHVHGPGPPFPTSDTETDTCHGVAVSLKRVSNGVHLQSGIGHECAEQLQDS